MRLTPDLLSKIADDIDRGVPIWEIAAYYGVHEQTLYKAKRTGRLPRAPSVLTDDDIFVIEVLLLRLPTMAAVAARVIRHRHTIARIATRLDRSEFGRWPNEAQAVARALELRGQSQ